MSTILELVCQTLLVEGIIKSCDKVLRVDDYLHLNVIPAGNKELRSDVCTFSDGLIDSSKYLINVSSTKSEQCKLCVNGPLYIDTRLLWKQTIGSNGP